MDNTRGGTEGKIGERGVWGANSSPGCSLFHDVPDKKIVLDGFFYFFNCFTEKDYDPLGSVIYNLYGHNTSLIQTHVPLLQKPDNSPMFKRVLGQARYNDIWPMDYLLRLVAGPRYRLLL